ncbi:MAG TPA: hypothetical protein DIU15_04445, partial [Deltaproteobacteria bacterium]|nr:hypothetical protein [Deltaproteobacteria bacterium]
MEADEQPQKPRPTDSEHPGSTRTRQTGGPIHEVRPDRRRARDSWTATAARTTPRGPETPVGRPAPHLESRLRRAMGSLLPRPNSRGPADPQRPKRTEKPVSWNLSGASDSSKSPVRTPSGRSHDCQRSGSPGMVLPSFEQRQMTMATKKTNTSTKGTSPQGEAHTNPPITTSGSVAGVGSVHSLDDTTLIVQPPESNEPVSAAGQSDVGRVRELNEDNWHLGALNDDLMLYAVADGMGGHDRGEVASKLAVQTLFEAAREGLEDLSDTEVTTLRSLLRKCVQTANERVVITGIEEESNMGTTLCAALMHEESDAIIANV